MKKIIKTTEAPQAKGPYSQAIESNGMLFVSGQIPINPNNGNITGDSIKEQTAQVLSNIKAVLTAAGFSIENVVKTTCYLKDMKHFSEMNEVYSEFFSTDPPARAAVEVSCLPRDVLIEIEAIATKWSQ